MHKSSDVHFTSVAVVDWYLNVSIFVNNKKNLLLLLSDEALLRYKKGSQPARLESQRKWCLSAYKVMPLYANR